MEEERKEEGKENETGGKNTGERGETRGRRKKEN